MYDLSIIVPVYNIEKYVKQAIESLLNSVPGSVEIVLVDDGATDSSGIICQSYAGVPNVRVIHKANGGLPSARKAGVEAAGGRYITFLDGDDWVDADYYSNMLEKAMQHDADIVCSGFTVEFSDRQKKGDLVMEDGLYTSDNINLFRDKILYFSPYHTYGLSPSLCMKVIKADVLRKYIKAVPDHLTLAEDACCTFPAMYECERIYALRSNCGYHYRQSESSMSRRFDPLKRDRILAAIHCFDAVMNRHYPLYGAECYALMGSWLKDALTNEVCSKGGLRSMAEKIAALREDAVVERVLANQKKVPFLIGVELALFRCRCFIGLIVLLRLYRAVKMRFVRI